MRILFVCTGNTCRSPMAEKIADLLAEEMGLNHSFSSAGINADNGCGATIGAMDAIEIFGGDLTDHSAVMVNEDMISDVDLVLTMTQAHKRILLSKYNKYKDKIFTIKEIVNKTGDIGDPFGQSTEVYLKIAQELADIITEILKKYS